MKDHKNLLFLVYSKEYEWHQCVIFIFKTLLVRVHILSSFADEYYGLLYLRIPENVKSMPFAIVQGFLWFHFQLQSAGSKIDQ